MQFSRNTVNGLRSNNKVCGNLGYRLHPGTIFPFFADLSSTTHV